MFFCVLRVLRGQELTANYATGTVKKVKLCVSEVK